EERAVQVTAVRQVGDRAGNVLRSGNSATILDMANKQEQEHAQTGVTEVAPGVLRMQLPIQMPGLGHVNCYAFADDRGIAVVDTGVPGPGTWKALKERMRDADLDLRAIHT